LRHATADTIRLVGGTPCLDFANTVIWDAPGSPRPRAPDVLGHPEALAAWGARLGLLAQAAQTPAAKEHESARVLRSTVHAVFAVIANKASPPEDALQRLHDVYLEAVDRAELRERAGRWILSWPSEDARSLRLAIATDAFELLSDPARLARVRQCPGRDCGGLFVDLTGRRRWCSMEACGSREKMRRLYERQRAAGATPDAAGGSPG
jgi:predicted RNA-binding Zn ribbon-like protein